MDSSACPPVRILVVDDDEMVRETLRLLLEVDHHIVETAGNASQALQMFQPGRFDLVITDYDMRGMKGDQLAAAIKGLAPTEPVLMLTGYGESVQTQPGLLKNLDGVIPKPFRIETLREAIARAFPAKGLPTCPVQMDLFVRDSTIRL